MTVSLMQLWSSEPNWSRFSIDRTDGTAIVHARTETFVFEPFRLQPERRLLLANGLPVTLTPRAYDILEFLVRNRDRVVTRDEIVAHVWRGVTVGENNLSVQMSTLRHALAEPAGKKPLIVNIPGRGYRFVVEVDADVEVNECPTDEAELPGQSGKIEHPSERLPRRIRLRKLIIFGLVASVFITIGSAMEIMQVVSSLSDSVVTTRPDLRLSIGVGAFTKPTYWQRNIEASFFRTWLFFRISRFIPISGQP
jgi:DNA-binding winged helix-turn-helix (wHTH) protein